MKKEVYLILGILFVLVISACSSEELTGQVINNESNETNCTNDCTSVGQKTCNGNYRQICGYYDSDSCLDWSSSYCAYGCANGECNNQTNTTCTNECSYTGQRSCSGNYIRLCGNYDSDSCLEWASTTYCSTGCSNGYCNNQTNTTCTDSDGGINYYVRGTASSSNSSQTDYCTNKILLLENYCSANGAIIATTYSCPYGCKSGACIMGNNQSNTTTGTMYITSIPSSAYVYVDKIYKGKTPRYVYNLVLGYHTVKFVKSGYTPVTRTVNIIAGTTNVSATLVPIVNCTNDCSYIGQRQCNGSYALVCGKYDSDPCYDWLSSYCASGCSGGYCNNQTNLTIIQKSPANTSNSTNGTGVLYVRSGPAMANIYIDGVLQRGYTPKVITEVATGVHTITLKKANFPGCTQQFTVRKGVVNNFYCRLGNPITNTNIMAIA